MNDAIRRKNGRFHHLTAFAVLGGAALAAACSSPPFKAAEPEGSGGAGENTGGAETDGGGGETGGLATGGTGGASSGGDAGQEMDGGGVGEASAGGGRSEEDSGTGVTPECARDSDCAALTCNGAPRCNAGGKCDRGLPCENPDAEHCSVSCVRSGGRATCETKGLDQDADGHLDAACVSGGGDDCDDRSPTTYAGAAEQCDGVDNDCNGTTDAADGLGLSGIPTLVHETTGTGSLGMAAAPDGYGVLMLVRPEFLLTEASSADFISLAHAAHGSSETRTDAYAVGATAQQIPVVVRIDDSCRVEPGVPLAAKGDRVALGNNRPILEVGHPVIASYQDGRIGTAWVEEPRSSGLHRVMFRTFGSKLCN
jgi:hypothetical protein